jgi:enoyl-CoA hydratase/carnithine racemase
MRLEHPKPGVLVVTLDRPDRLNAQTKVMFDEFQELADHLRHDRETRAVVLTGAGRAFCAGYDLADADDLSTLGARGMLALQTDSARALESLRAIPQPLIAAVNGAATGGGFSLSLAADIRLAAPAARFNAAFVRIGLTAGDLGCSWHLPRLVGPGLAAEIMFTGRFVDAEEAARIGLVNRVVPADELLDAAFDMAAQIASNSPFGVQLTKSALQANLDGVSLHTALELENRGQALATRHPDMPEALSAFKERRPPNFAG